MIASIIIPHYNRPDKLKRAVESILNQNGSDSVEIIIVDDCSSSKPVLDNLRPHDKIIFHESNLGPAVARNTGLEHAIGSIIYFLDSDDYFICKDFLEDYNKVFMSESLYYCDFTNGKFTSSFNIELGYDDYLASIFSSCVGICNTCTMVFSAHLKPKFDYTLPKHEDWDFVFFNFVNNRRSVLKIEGLTYIDQSDRKSLSRAPDIKKDIPWLNKLKENLSVVDFNYAEFCILNKYPAYSWYLFLINSFRYIYYRKFTFKLFLKRLAQRVLISFFHG